MRKKWTIEQSLRGQNQRAKQAGARHDLTMEQWMETLEYFDHKCAYCGAEYQVIEHYLPIYKAGTTVSNCVPACLHCNIMKDRKGHDLTFHQNENVMLWVFHPFPYPSFNVTIKVPETNRKPTIISEAFAAMHLWRAFIIRTSVL